jgi:hypothetical protein
MFTQSQSRSFVKWLLVLALLEGRCCADTTDTVREKEDEVVRLLVLAQDRFHGLGLALETSNLQGLGVYPTSDWALPLGSKARTQKYSDLLNFAGTHVDSGLKQRVSNTRYSYPWDVLRIYPVPDDLLRADDALGHLGFSMKLHVDLSQGEMQTDPFCDSCYLGYVGTNDDYLLVSVGPDGNPDLLGFVQYRDGTYAVGGKRERVKDIARVQALAQKLIPVGNSWGEVRVDWGLVYDPTNGLTSRGDVVFHRRQGDNYMFSFESNRCLRAQEFVRKNLNELKRKSWME